MPSSHGVRSFSIHFDGEDADAHVLPAPVLIESIAQIQRIVLLLAKMFRASRCSSAPPSPARSGTTSPCSAISPKPAAMPFR